MAAGFDRRSARPSTPPRTLQSQGLRAIVRAHMVQQTGFEVLGDNEVMTVFSASDYRESGGWVGRQGGCRRWVGSKAAGGCTRLRATQARRCAAAIAGQAVGVQQRRTRVRLPSGSRPSPASRRALCRPPVCLAGNTGAVLRIAASLDFEFVTFPALRASSEGGSVHGTATAPAAAAAAPPPPPPFGSPPKETASVTAPAMLPVRSPFAERGAAAAAAAAAGAGTSAPVEPAGVASPTRAAQALQQVRGHEWYCCRSGWPRQNRLHVHESKPSCGR